MQIDRIFYPVKTLGFGNRIGIWTLGCPHHCLNCSNPELWEPDADKDISLQQLFAVLSNIKGKIDGVTITGGEPFFQPFELAQLVKYFNYNGIGDILVYSGYTLDELEAMNNQFVNEVLSNIAVLIDGKYIEDLNDNMPLRGSSNQIIHILRQEYKARYNLVHGQKRSVQNIFYNNSVISIGIPIKEYRSKIQKKLSQRGVKGSF